MDYSLGFAPSALRDLRDIVRYISIDNPARAEAFGATLIAKTRHLAAFPEIGRKVPELNDPILRKSLSDRTASFTDFGATRNAWR